MHKHNDFCVKTLREIVDYNPETGVIKWRARTAEHFSLAPAKINRAMNTWNARYAGCEITGVLTSGHIGLHVNMNGVRRRMLAHRAAWALTYGVWPRLLIDHINGNPSDNRLVNLRECTSSENNRNKKTTNKNTSGFVGVTRHRPSGKWRAWIKVEGVTTSLGYFESKADAISARKAADAIHGFDEARKYEGAAA